VDTSTLFAHESELAPRAAKDLTKRHRILNGEFAQILLLVHMLKFISFVGERPLEVNC
jgi:hypothetical protein